MKYCIDCHQPKPRTEYYTQPGSWDGYRATCKDCFKKRQKGYRERQKNVSVARGQAN